MTRWAMWTWQPLPELIDEICAEGEKFVEKLK